MPCHFSNNTATTLNKSAISITQAQLSGIDCSEIKINNRSYVKIDNKGKKFVEAGQKLAHNELPLNNDIDLSFNGEFIFCSAFVSPAVEMVIVK